jgi:hypothetical protein
MILTMFLMFIIFTIFQSSLIENGEIHYFALVVAGFAAVLGADLPDFDYRYTKIRHALGPVLAGFITIGYLYTKGTDASLEVAASIFISIVIAFALIGILPLKHHGRLHSISAAFGYCIGWALISYYLLEINGMVWIVIIMLFSFAGYFLHLLLDLDLKL